MSCVVREKLVQLYEEAAEDHHRLNLARMTDVIDGPDTPSEEEVREAQMRKESAQYILLQHLGEHGCGCSQCRTSLEFRKRSVAPQTPPPLT